MENLAMLLKWYNKYNYYYFFKETFLKNRAGRVKAAFIVTLNILAVVFFIYMKNIFLFSLFSAILAGEMFFFVRKVNKKYAEAFKLYPGTMKLLSQYYLNFRLVNFLKEMKGVGNFNQRFIYLALKECDTQFSIASIIVVFIGQII